MDNLFLWDKTGNVFFKVEREVSDEELENIISGYDYELVRLTYSEEVHRELDYLKNDDLYSMVFNLIEKTVTDNSYNKFISNLNTLLEKITESYYNFYLTLHNITKNVVKDICSNNLRLTKGVTGDNIVIDLDAFMGLLSSDEFINYAKI